MSDGRNQAGGAAAGGRPGREAGHGPAHGDVHEVAHVRVGGDPVGHGIHDRCANCDTLRRGPYCHHCGQAGHVHRTASALLHDLLHGVFHVEGKLWATLPLLVWRPGALTRRYVMGERAKFVSPVALFLFSVFLLFAVVSGPAGEAPRTQARAQRDLVAERTRAAAEVERIALQRAGAVGEDERVRLDRALAQARAAVQGIDTAIALGDGVENRRPIELDTGWRWLDEGAAHASANPALTLHKIRNYAYKYSWALIPLSLPFLWLLFLRRRDVGLYDHAVFATYSLSFMSLGAVAATLVSRTGLDSVAQLGMLVVPPLHMYRQLKGAYLLGRGAALWRTAALMVIVTITGLLFLALLLYLGAR